MTEKNKNVDLPVTVMFLLLAMTSLILMIYIMVEILKGDSRPHTIIGGLVVSIIFFGYVYRAYLGKTFIVKFEK